MIGNRLRILIITGLMPLLLTGCNDAIVNHYAFFPSRFSAGDYDLSGSAVEEVSLQTADNIRLHGFYLPRPDSRKLVLFFHGNGGHALHRLRDAEQLAAKGVNVLLIDYRGYGRSEGEPSEWGVYLDAATTLRYATRTLEFAPQDIFILGRSLGSAIAIDLAQGQSLGGLILAGSFTSGHAVMDSAGMGWLDWFVSRRPFDQLAKLERIDTPALFIHGRRDRQIPFRLGEALYQRYPSSHKSLVSVSNAGHNDLFPNYGPRLWSRIAAFIQAPQQYQNRVELW
ncbi:alpha/beta hydrolase [Marinobacterium jannaschii]|uniref:alpha/beta hydrolase n=1 Tax=Marinobacterium jannaschii TaxID=64970 RepID=UPI0006851BB3|nr:alpha/beta hydrolase [Marinobacterium jannaschii]